MNHVDFAVPPSIGTVIRLDDQEYEVVGADPYTRKDGSPTTLLTWVSPCPKCHEPFEVKTGLIAKALVRRCPACRSPTAKPVKGRRGRKVKVSIVTT